MINLNLTFQNTKTFLILLFASILLISCGGGGSSTSAPSSSSQPANGIAYRAKMTFPLPNAELGGVGYENSARIAGVIVSPEGDTVPDNHGASVTVNGIAAEFLQSDPTYWFVEVPVSEGENLITLSTTPYRGSDPIVEQHTINNNWLLNRLGNRQVVYDQANNRILYVDAESNSLNSIDLERESGSRAFIPGVILPLVRNIVDVGSDNFVVLKVFFSYEQQKLFFLYRYGVETQTQALMMVDLATNEKEIIASYQEGSENYESLDIGNGALDLNANRILFPSEDGLASFSLETKENSLLSINTSIDTSLTSWGLKAVHKSSDTLYLITRDAVLKLDMLDGGGFGPSYESTPITFELEFGEPNPYIELLSSIRNLFWFNAITNRVLIEGQRMFINIDLETGEAAEVSMEMSNSVNPLLYFGTYDTFLYQNWVDYSLNATETFRSSSIVAENSWVNNSDTIPGKIVSFKIDDESKSIYALTDNSRYNANDDWVRSNNILSVDLQTGVVEYFQEAVDLLGFNRLNHERLDFDRDVAKFYISRPSPRNTTIVSIDSQSGQSDNLLTEEFVSEYLLEEGEQPVWTSGFVLDEANNRFLIHLVYQRSVEDGYEISDVFGWYDYANNDWTEIFKIPFLDTQDADNQGFVLGSGDANKSKFAVSGWFSGKVFILDTVQGEMNLVDTSGSSDDFFAQGVPAYDYDNERVLIRERNQNTLYWVDISVSREGLVTPLNRGRGVKPNDSPQLDLKNHRIFAAIERGIVVIDAHTGDTARILW